MNISISYFHGCGDCALFAHSIPLYLSRGHTVEVQCTPDKEPLFLAAGASITPKAQHSHPYLHPSKPGEPLLSDHWSGNKVAWSISAAPMPQIGGYWDLWDELCATRLSLQTFITDAQRAKISNFLADLPKPIILIHSEGNTGQQFKNLDHQTEAELYRGLLDRTDGTLILLDWDNRVTKLASYRVRHLTDDWERLSTLELVALIEAADLLIGIDSGPLHLTRFTDTPAIGVWTQHFPSHFALPRAETLHVVGGSNPYASWIPYRRNAYNIVKAPSGMVQGDYLAEVAAQMLSEPRYVSDRASDAVLRQLVGSCRTSGGTLSNYVDRHRSFDLVLRWLRSRHRPVIVETGCMRAAEDYGAGMSTYLIGKFLSLHGGHLVSVELSETNAGFARQWTSAFGCVEVVQQHSHDWLRSYAGEKIDLFYSDSADVGVEGYEQNCLMECQLVQPHLSEVACLCVDDTVFAGGKWKGKGSLAVPWLLSNGWKLRYAGYQALLTRGEM